MNDADFYNILKSLENIKQTDGSPLINYFDGYIPIVDDDNLNVGTLKIEKFNFCTYLTFTINDGPDVSISLIEKFKNKKLKEEKSLYDLFHKILLQISKDYNFPKTYKLGKHEK